MFGFLGYFYGIAVASFYLWIYFAFFKLSEIFRSLNLFFFSDILFLYYKDLSL